MRRPLAVVAVFFLLSLRCAVATADAGSSEADEGEYDAILALDDAELAQLVNGWHGGVTLDNAVPEEDGNVNFGADLRYQFSDGEFSSALQAVDRDIYRAQLQYAQMLFTSSATRWRGIASTGYQNDALRETEFKSDFEDHDTDAALALQVEHDFASVLVSSQLQSRWRRFERRGQGLILDQSTALDVEKDFRALAWNLAAQWQLDAADQSLWLQVTRVTDMDVAACFDDICYAADVAEKTFTLYQATFDQAWYLTVQHSDGVSLLTRLAAYSASVDHLPINYQFSIGGMHSVRGYDEAIAGGDEMVLWRNELRLPWHAAFDVLAGGERQYAYLFYDWGRVQQHAVGILINARRFELLPETSTRLAACGVGLDLAVASDITLRLEYAVVQAGIDGLVDAGDTRIHASLDWRAF